MVRCGGRSEYEASDNACLIEIPGMAPAQRNLAGAVIVDQQSLNQPGLRRRA
jgi:hypothetical protein